MNERLKEIEKQATRRIETKVRKGGWDNDREPYEYKTVVDTFFDKEKFAELIVRECSKVITDLPNRMVDAELSPYNEGWRNGRLLAKEHIEQHFGVENEQA